MAAMNSSNWGDVAFVRQLARSDRAFAMRIGDDVLVADSYIVRRMPYVAALAGVRADHPLATVADGETVSWGSNVTALRKPANLVALWERTVTSAAIPATWQRWLVSFGEEEGPSRQEFARCFLLADGERIFINTKLLADLDVSAYSFSGLTRSAPLVVRREQQPVAAIMPLYLGDIALPRIQERRDPQCRCGDALDQIATLAAYKGAGGPKDGGYQDDGQLLVRCGQIAEAALNDPAGSKLGVA